MKKTFNFIKIILIFLGLIYFIIFIFNLVKPLPKEINYKSKDLSISSDQIDFLYDLTYLDKNNNIKHEQEIFDSIFYHIKNAEKYILIDMFLFNSYMGNDNNTFRDITGELTSKLFEKKKQNPGIKIDFITDPINTVYGGSTSDEMELLKIKGINVIQTNLNRLRDSNPVYSSLWRIFFKIFGNSKKHGILPHPFSKSKNKVTLRSYLSLLNFKANHRKVFVCDYQDDMISFIMSANPHNGSSAHSNVAFKIKGDIWKEIYFSEDTISKFSKRKLFKHTNLQEKSGDGNIKINLITEKMIKKELINLIKKTKSNDEIYIAMFYLSERKIINELINASKRNVKINIILDPNKDAFGYKKNGTPNRQVAHELIKKSKNRIKIRWFNTHGEQFHTKLIVIKDDNNSSFILGSANLTRRNISSFNLETDIKVTCNNNDELADKISNYFKRIWNNTASNSYTVDYEKYSNEKIISSILYRIEEFSGLCTF